MLYTSTEEQILLKLQELKHLPAPNPVVIKLISALTEDTTDFQQVADIIKQDSSLCAQVLKIANSAYYGLRQQVDSMEKAIQVLGVKEIRSLALVLCFLQEFNIKDLPSEFDHQAYWTHSLLTASISRQAAKRSKTMREPEELYICGLLHKIGLLLLASVASDEWLRIYRVCHEQQIPWIEAENSLKIRHSAIGLALATYWNFPRLMASVIRFYPTPEQCPGFSQECAIVNLACCIAHETPEEHQSYSETPCRERTEILHIAGLSTDDFQEISDYAGTIREDIGEVAKLFV